MMVIKVWVYFISLPLKQDYGQIELWKNKQLHEKDAKCAYKITTIKLFIWQGCNQQLCNQFMVQIKSMGAIIISVAFHK